MLIPLNDVVKKYKVPVGTRVVHVGAHEAQEYAAYKGCGFSKVVWIEGNDDIAAGLTSRFINEPDQLVVAAVLADKERVVSFHEASFDQSSSILPLGTHAQMHPEVTYVGETKKVAKTLDMVADRTGIHGYEFLNLDVQGAEQMVLNGGLRFLKGVNYVYSEVNAEELYKGCTLKPEFDAFLDEQGFDCVETEMTHFQWGDSFYVRRELV